jgi:hypothetical protein
MTTHNLETSIFALVPYVALVLEGNVTEKTKDGDIIETKLVKYRVDSSGYDRKANLTTIVVREIVP